MNNSKELRENITKDSGGIKNMNAGEASENIPKCQSNGLRVYHTHSEQAIL